MRIVVSGDFACFTNPATKVERVSYPVITASAAEGVLKSVYWKKEMRYVLNHLYVLKMGETLSLKTNELRAFSETQPTSIQKERTQRRNLILKDVSYMLDFEIESMLGTVRDRIKHEEIFLRRMERGTYFRKPCLGLSECVADVRIATEADVPAPVNRDLGTMLQKIEYADDGAKAIFARARIIYGEIVYLAP